MMIIIIVVGVNFNINIDIKTCCTLNKALSHQTTTKTNNNLKLWKEVSYIRCRVEEGKNMQGWGQNTIYTSLSDQTTHYTAAFLTHSPSTTAMPSS